MAIAHTIAGPSATFGATGARVAPLVHLGGLSTPAPGTYSGAAATFASSPAAWNQDEGHIKMAAAANARHALSNQGLTPSRLDLNDDAFSLVPPPLSGTPPLSLPGTP